MSNIQGMKTRYLLPVLLLVFFSSAKAQYYQIDLGTLVQEPCEVDSNTTVNTYSKVRMYSTTDDTWYGPEDSLLCYSLIQIGSSWRFPTASVPTDRSVFFEIALDSALTLDTSTVYLLWSLLYSESESVHIRFEMPDSSGNDTVSTMIDMSFEDQFEQVICFPTQKIIGQRISGVIYEYHSLGTNFNTYLNSPNLEPHFDGTQIIPQLTYPDINWGPNLVRYWHDIYPTADSVSYTDVMPYGNPTDSTLIQFYVYSDASLHFQDYTALRGALVEGSDSIRHGLDVILEGNMCLHWVEVLWEGGSHLVVDGGTIGIHGSSSCNLFGKGGGLTIRSGTKFHYGHNGVGMMALKTGGQLKIEPGAELIIDGPMFIYEYYEDPEPQQIYMELPVGAKLTFAEGSTLSNQFSKDGTMKLNIYMRGGDLDLSGLTAEEQQLINLIYDKPSPQSWENLTVYPNPTAEDVQLLWVAEDMGEDLTYEVFNQAGQLVLSGQLTTSTPGHNKLGLNTKNLVSGTYLIRLTGGGEVLARRRFVKL